jgi:iron complex transport system ATP-binding protein
VTAQLRFLHASVGYRGRAVVTDVDLDLHPGEVVGLVGPNGAGKSTLLRAVTLDAEILGGSIEIEGSSVAALDPRHRARLVGVVPQTMLPVGGFSARELVMMGRHSHLPRFGKPSEEDDRVVADAMEMTDTLRLAETGADELSGGDLQRVALAQALAQEPGVLLLDEPVSHLDLNHRLQVLDLVHLLARSGLAILVVFHDLDLAARFADRVAIVASGRVRSADRPEAVLTADAVHEVFGVRAVVGVDPVTGAMSVVPVLRDGAVAERHRGSVFVVGGSGAAAPLFRRLVLSGWTVTSGALNTGDADQVVAAALGLEFPEIAPFAPMDEPAAARAEALARSADVVVVTEVPFGNGNTDNLRAAVVAVEAGVRGLFVGHIDGRDFTEGEAGRLWARGIEAGAEEVADLSAVEAALDPAAERTR